MNLSVKTVPPIRQYRHVIGKRHLTNRNTAAERECTPNLAYIRRMYVSMVCGETPSSLAISLHVMPDARRSITTRSFWERGLTGFPDCLTVPTFLRLAVWRQESRCNMQVAWAACAAWRRVSFLGITIQPLFLEGAPQKSRRASRLHIL